MRKNRERRETQQPTIIIGTDGKQYVIRDGKVEKMIQHGVEPSYPRTPNDPIRDFREMYGRPPTAKEMSWLI